LVSTTADVTDTQAPPFLPLSVGVDSGAAFYTLWSGATNASVTRRIGVDGQNGADLFQGGYFVAPDGTNLFTASDAFVVSMTEAGANQAVVPGSTNTDMIATYQGIVEHGSDIYLTSYGSWSDGQSLVQGCGWVTKVPKAGGTRTVLWAGKGRPGHLAVDDTSVTWADFDNQSVVRLVP
jgi:hypothetical protein